MNDQENDYLDPEAERLSRILIRRLDALIKGAGPSAPRAVRLAAIELPGEMDGQAMTDAIVRAGVDPSKYDELRATVYLTTGGARTKALWTLDVPRLRWLVEGAALEQLLHIVAYRKVEVIAAWRDEMFAGFGGRYGARLTDMERRMLRTSDVTYLAAEEMLAATEDPLIAFARSWLWAHADVLRRQPLYAVLLDSALGGQRTAALKLAAWLGFDPGSRDRALTAEQRHAI